MCCAVGAAGQPQKPPTFHFVLKLVALLNLALNFTLGVNMSAQALGTMRASGPRTSGNQVMRQGQHGRYLGPSARQPRNPAFQVRAAYENTPGMVEMDVQSSSRTITSNSATASTSARSTPVSYRISLFDALKFNGPAPERINGRIAMVTFLFAAQKEHLTGQTFYQQLSNPEDWVLAILVAVTIYATMVPVLRGVRDEDFFMFRVNAEKLNGRLAMLGWAGIIALEELYAHASFF